MDGARGEAEVLEGHGASVCRCVGFPAHPAFSRMWVKIVGWAPLFTHIPTR